MIIIKYVLHIGATNKFEVIFSLSTLNSKGVWEYPYYGHYKVNIPGVSRLTYIYIIWCLNFVRFCFNICFPKKKKLTSIKVSFNLSQNGQQKVFWYSWFSFIDKNISLKANKIKIYRRFYHTSDLFSCDHTKLYKQSRQQCSLVSFTTAITFWRKQETVKMENMETNLKNTFNIPELYKSLVI